MICHQVEGIGATCFIRWRDKRIWEKPSYSETTLKWFRRWHCRVAMSGRDNR
ncbi:hypothetical protein NOC27_1673 [Nitrosococcus oceani AFC27]|nr:hypothetical protein NOC27_1673 [Nitrosococcus oceani AFC27]